MPLERTVVDVITEFCLRATRKSQALLIKDDVLKDFHIDGLQQAGSEVCKRIFKRTYP